MRIKWLTESISRTKMEIIELGLDIDGTIFRVIVQKDDELRIFMTGGEKEEQISFNTSLFSKSFNDLLLAKAMIENGANQSKLRSALGDTQGIKFWFVLKLSEKFPLLHLLERCRVNKVLKRIRHHIVSNLFKKANESEVDAYIKTCES